MIPSINLPITHIASAHAIQSLRFGNQDFNISLHFSPDLYPEAQEVLTHRLSFEMQTKLQNAMNPDFLNTTYRDMVTYCYSLYRGQPVKLKTSPFDAFEYLEGVIEKLTKKTSLEPKEQLALFLAVLLYLNKDKVFSLKTNTQEVDNFLREGKLIEQYDNMAPIDKPSNSGMPELTFGHWTHILNNSLKPKPTLQQNTFLSTTFPNHYRVIDFMNLKLLLFSQGMGCLCRTGKPFDYNSRSETVISADQLHKFFKATGCKITLDPQEADLLMQPVITDALRRLKNCSLAID